VEGKDWGKEKVKKFTFEFILVTQARKTIEMNKNCVFLWRG
jgi:hypothetical protein